MNDSRSLIIQSAIVLVALIYLIKLFSIQVLDDTYQTAAESNVVQRLTEYPYRGLIYDRNSKLIVYNDPVYDLMVVPREVENIDTLLLCRLLHIDQPEFEKRMIDARKYSWVKPSIFFKQLSIEDFAALQDELINLRGFYPIARTVRSYTEPTMANALGYIGEINKYRLEQDTTKYYKSGDYIGLSGIEASYENHLRGKRGVRYRLVNVRGIEKGSFKDGAYDTLPVPGENLYSTIDLDLQRYAEKLLKGKIGSLVAIEPSSGEILSIVSAPSYDPNVLTGRLYSSNYNVLQNDSLVPLFNRPIMATYPPGSIFKIAQSLAAMQEGIITPATRIVCNRNLIACHGLHSNEDLKGAITVSCNPYFREVYRRMLNKNDDPNTFIDSRIGLERWRQYMLNLGFGHTLGIDIPNEKGGYVPQPSLYNRIYGEKQWKFSNIFSNAIGQGELLVVPLQMANFTAIVANRGYYYPPHLIKSVGESGQPLEKYRQKVESGVDSRHFDVVVDAMEEVVRSGTGQYRAKLKDIIVCGKTGTVQNSQGEDHSVFIAFAPKDNPVIAIAVYVEQGGQGARAAAAICGLMIEQYINGKTDRPWIEEYVLKGKFGN